MTVKFASMLSKIVTIHILTLLGTISAWSNHNFQCSENEEYKECGTACQKSCTLSTEFCTFQCVEGCFCKPGFIRLSDDRSPCIPISQCSCSKNEFFNPCASACPDTCTERSQMCTKQCVPSCACKDGFIRATNQSNSACIAVSECSNQLCKDPNAEYLECGPTCPKTCTEELDPILKLRFCPPVCRAGCFCKPDFVLGDNGRCVKPEACCQKVNATYQTCGSACPRSCASKNKSFCILPCMTGCFCGKNHVRKTSDMNSPCIHQNDCE